MTEQSSNREPVEGNAPISHGPVQQGSVGPVQQQQQSVDMITGQQDGPSEAPGYRQVEGGTVVDGRTRENDAVAPATTDMDTRTGRTAFAESSTVEHSRSSSPATGDETVVVRAGGHSGSHPSAHNGDMSAPAAVEPSSGTSRAEMADASEHAHADALLRPEAAERSAGDMNGGTRGAGVASGSNTTPAGYASEGGKWPARGSEESPGVHTDDGGEITTAMAAPGETLIPTQNGAIRAADAATGSGPYVDPAEDMERVGATSGLASNAAERSSWNVASTAYRSSWESRQGGNGRWEDAEPAYRYGHEMGSDPRFSGRHFDDAESDLRSGYRTWRSDRGYPTDDSDSGDATGESAWQKVKESTREAWDKVRGKG